MLRKRHIHELVIGLAAAMLAGPWEKESLLTRTAETMGRRWRWRRALITNMLKHCPAAPEYGTLLSLIRADTAFQQVLQGDNHPHIVRWFPRRTAMRPAFPEWEVRQLHAQADIANWLGVTAGQLDWLADCERRQGRSDESVRRHYNYQWHQKRRGGQRLIEAPRFLLRSVQRRIVDDILNHITPHPAACAFRTGYSVIDYAAPHAGRSVVLRLDMQDFFASVAASRIHALFTAIGYPNEVARTLTGLCTTTTPSTVCRRHRGSNVYRSPHLPQGAPTSPALANLCTRRLDARLHAAAQRMGANYTRYADDMAFSGDDIFLHKHKRFLQFAWQIIQDEGFQVNHHKTRVMHQGVRQHLGGLVVNHHPNIDRRQYDMLKAILSNCRRYGPASQNREAHPDFQAHLAGRIAYVQQVAPARATRLCTIYDQIIWPPPGPSGNGCGSVHSNL